MWTVGSGSTLVPPISGQQWRDFLAAVTKLFRAGHGQVADMDVDEGITSSSHTLASTSSIASTQGQDSGEGNDKGKKKRVARKVKQNTFLATQPLLSHPPNSIFWHEKTIMLGSQEELEAQLTPTITGEILWELYELNFRFELLTLDRTVAPSMWGALGKRTAEEQMAQRDIAVRRVFPLDGFVISSYLVEKIPNRNLGLAADDWKERAAYIFTLSTLMQSWEGCPSSIKYAAEVMVEARVEALEGEVTKFYCQTFFDYFGRAPILPHRLPLTPSTSLSS